MPPAHAQAVQGGEGWTVARNSACKIPQALVRSVQHWLSAIGLSGSGSRVDCALTACQALRQWWYFIPHEEIRHKDVVRESHKQYSETLNRTILALLGVAFFCLLTALGSPDTLLIRANSTIKIPFADAPMSFVGFIVVAPFLLIVLLLYLHIFYGYWLTYEWERQCINQRLIPPLRVFRRSSLSLLLLPAC